jgi:hypothetical protein
MAEALASAPAAPRPACVPPCARSGSSSAAPTPQPGVSTHAACVDTNDLEAHLDGEEEALLPVLSSLSPG